MYPGSEHVRMGKNKKQRYTRIKTVYYSILEGILEYTRRYTRVYKGILEYICIYDCYSNTSWDVGEDHHHRKCRKDLPCNRMESESHTHMHTRTHRHTHAHTHAHAHTHTKSLWLGDTVKPLIKDPLRRGQPGTYSLASEKKAASQ